MKTSENIHAELLERAYKARSLRMVFDRFWKTEPTRRQSAHHTYFIREVALINAFDNFMFLFCSRELWTAGGTGAWANTCNVNGPLKPLSNGDQIDKIISLLTEQKEASLKIIGIHKTRNEHNHLLYELEHIGKIIELFTESMKEIQI
ncbi:hypothetical protein [Pedobacter aquatilis]|uniref:hypothetical protein n=1 Tax=Pedobacter aquatilis TaxID=351343 RepID=UPI002931277A|nr:hypothetical protein [Pedobacter aquatilis]